MLNTIKYSINKFSHLISQLISKITDNKLKLKLKLASTNSFSQLLFLREKTIDF